MYIKSLEIKNIRAIEHFKMDFENPAGWHVLLGDNGSGKSSIIRAIALGLLGEDHAHALSSFEDYSNWLPPKIEKGEIEIKVSRDNDFDKPFYKVIDALATSNLTITRKNGNGKIDISGNISPTTALWGKDAGTGWYVAAYGPFRRLRGGTDFFAHLNSSKPRLGACISAFRDDVALTQLTAWLKDLALDARKKPNRKKILNNTINFINTAHLLPNGAKLLDDIDSDGIKLTDARGTSVSLYEMSDGHRSILSMTLDIIRFLTEIYDSNKVFDSPTQINLPGVVLIDEIDAHLHPSWQTQIGKWFTKYFPNIQFIVTTHSPLICRACEKGSIWRLATPNTDQITGEVTGLERDKLIYGNILDAYGTELFGQSPVRSENNIEKINRLAKLDMRSSFGKITEEEEKERQHLQLILSTDATTL